MAARRHTGSTAVSFVGTLTTCPDCLACHLQDICLDSEGSYRCECAVGYEAQTGAVGGGVGNASEAPVNNVGGGLVLHRVSGQPLLGAACIASCAEPCTHGGACIGPNKCGAFEDDQKCR